MQTPVFKLFMTVINELLYEGKDFVQKQDITEQMNNHFCSLVVNKPASGIPDTASEPEDFLNRTDLNFCFSQPYFQS